MHYEQQEEGTGSSTNLNNDGRVLFKKKVLSYLAAH